MSDRHRNCRRSARHLPNCHKNATALRARTLRSAKGHYFRSCVRGAFPCVYWCCQKIRIRLAPRTPAASS